MEKEKKTKCTREAAESEPESGLDRHEEAGMKGEIVPAKHFGSHDAKSQNALALLGSQACGGLGLERAPLLVLRAWHYWAMRERMTTVYFSIR